MPGAPPQKPQRWSCFHFIRFLLYVLLVCMPIVVLSAYDWVSSAGALEASRDPRGSRQPLNCSEALGPKNHALFSNGARIIDKLTSPTKPIPISNLYASSFADESLARHVRTSLGPPSMPESALGLFSDDRALWFIDGAQGHLTFALAAPVLVRTVRLYGHDELRSCLPRHINVYGLVTPPDSKGVRWNHFDWPAGGFPVHLRQPFDTERFMFSTSQLAVWIPLGRIEEAAQAATHTDIPVSQPVIVEKRRVHVISLEFKQNWGAGYTCFAGLGVYDSVEA